MKKKSIVAIIPARGGSKRIPSKNIIDFMGKPMIAHTILAAIESNVFDDVIVSTDSAEIADVSMSYGASVPFIRERNKDDFSTVSDVAIDGLHVIENKLGKLYDQIALLLPNCPLRYSKQIIEAYENFKLNKGAFQISAFKFGWMNPWWAHTIINGKTERIFKDRDKNTRSQDLPDTFCPTGAIWIADTKSLIEANTFYGDGYSFFPMDWKNAVDIDDLEDLDMAKVVYGMINK